jgi:hypothetical protein
MMPRTGVALASLLFLVSSGCWAQQWGQVRSQEAQIPGTPDFVWKQSLPIRWGDPGINSIGGTELRALVVFDQKLFAAVGYWMDAETANPALPGAQVLRLDGPGAEWQVDLELHDRNPLGLRTHMAISTLEKVRFSTDGAGRQLAAPIDLLLAATFKRGVGLDVFSRATGSSPWSRISLPGEEQAPRGTQIRAFSLHKDQITGADIVFVGATHAIFAGTYDGEHRNIAWNSLPEWEGDPAGPPSGRARVARIADCNGKLYATSAGTIYERSDGRSPTWKKVFETTIHSDNSKVTGLRGLTCIRDSSRSSDVLLVGVEDNPARIYRIDPHQTDPAGGYKATLELDVSAFLTAALGRETTYAIVPYNKMIEYPDPAGGCLRLLLGLEAITPQAPETFGKQHFNPHGYYLVRDCNGTYALREIRDLQIVPPPELVAVRTLAVSPFQSDPAGTVYAGGFDANFNPVHNTAWLYKGVPTAAAQ